MSGLGGPARQFVPGKESFGGYSRWFEQFLLANGVAEEEDVRRRAIFLSVIGAKAFALLEDLLAPESITDLPYTRLVEVLRNHYEPRSSVIVARFRFNSCYRDDNEPVSTYMARLRKLAKACQFADGVLDEMLRDRLVCGIRDANLQSRLLSQPHLTLESALTLACASEAAVAQAQEIGRGMPAAATAPRPEADSSIGRVTQPVPPAARRAPPAAVDSAGRGGGAARRRPPARRQA